MVAPNKHKEEEKRQKTLESYSILDSLPEEDYDFITRMASQICGTPISYISLIDNDRQWLKSERGLGLSETARENSFCGHTINVDGDILIVEDTRKDERFFDNPIVANSPHLSFYAGVPLQAKNGMPLGALCVMDHSPKKLDKDQVTCLTSLSKQVMNLLELRKSKQSLELAMHKLVERNKALDRFAQVAAHDLKAPLHNIISLANLFLEQHGGTISAEGKEILGMIGNASTKLKGLIDGLLQYSKSEEFLKEGRTPMATREMVMSIMEHFSSEPKLSYVLTCSVDEINSNRTALQQIFINLITNAIKYNDKDLIKIEIRVSGSETHYHFQLKDNGPGIAPKDQESIFELFKTATTQDRYGEKGNGIGLSTVKRIVESLGGTISLQSIPGNGCNFIYSLAKN